MTAPSVTRRIAQEEIRDLAAESNRDTRIVLHENFKKRPVLAATLDPSTIDQAAQRLLTGANLDWIISGTNAANAGSALNVDGGILLTTAGADNDQIILSPATAINSVSQSPWGLIEWEPEHAPEFEAHIELPSIANIAIFAGLGLTAALDLTTDADAAKFLFSTEGATSTTKWTGTTSIGGTDVEADTGKAAVASKTIQLKIRIDSARRPRFSINGVEVYAGSALTAGVNLIPYIGLQALTGSAKSFAVRDIWLSRDKTALV